MDGAVAASIGGGRGGRSRTGRRRYGSGATRARGRTNRKWCAAGGVAASVVVGVFAGWSVRRARYVVTAVCETPRRLPDAFLAHNTRSRRCLCGWCVCRCRARVHGRWWSSRGWQRRTVLDPAVGRIMVRTPVTPELIYVWCAAAAAATRAGARNRRGDGSAYGPPTPGRRPSLARAVTSGDDRPFRAP